LSFTFTVALPEAWSADTVPFQAGFYDGQTQKYKWISNQLSAVLDVPDGGATIGLLGVAMLGLGYVRRRKT